MPCALCGSSEHDRNRCPWGAATVGDSMGTVLNYTPRPGTVPARDACNTSEAMEIVAIANIKFWYAWQRTVIRAMWGV